MSGRCYATRSDLDGLWLFEVAKFGVRADVIFMQVSREGRQVMKQIVRAGARARLLPVPKNSG
jgi:hypothetical protein